MGPQRTGGSISVTASHQGRRRIGSGHVDAALVARARPVSSSRDQLLPVLPALAPLFVRGGLQRGGVVTVHAAAGGTTLAFALLAAVTSAASWCAAVGTPDLGGVALAELGVDLAHLMLVPDPGAHWPDVTAALLEGVEVVLVRPSGPVRAGTARRLGARARERRAVLVVLASRPWPEGPDVQLTVEAGRWEGVEAGHGHLRGRQVVVASAGRRAATRSMRLGLWLPASSGRVASADEPPDTGRGAQQQIAQQIEQ